MTAGTAAAPHSPSTEHCGQRTRVRMLPALAAATAPASFVR